MNSVKTSMLTMSWVMVLVIILAQGPDPSCAAKSITVKKLTNGIRLQKINGVKLISAYWRLVIVIPPPRWGDAEEENGLALIGRVKMFVDRESMATVHIDKGIRKNLMQRMSILTQRMMDLQQHNVIFRSVDSSNRSRQRRGLINAGGWLLGKLFGVATHKDMEQIRELILQGNSARTAISHKVGELATAYNRMVEEQNQTRK